MLFGDVASGGEKIEGDGTDLTISSSRKLNLTATTDVHIPKDVGLVFDDDSSEKIESDNTDLSISSGGAINLIATTDVAIPDNVGMLFGDVNAGGEKIEGDGSRLKIVSSTALDLTASYVSIGNTSTNAGELRFFEDTDDGANYAAFKAPNVATSYTLLLPTAVGSANEVLRLADDSGTLEFASTAANVIKSVQVATGSLAAGQLMTGVVGSKINFSRPSDEEADNIIDVYVNGQLLASCSSTAFASIGAATTDGDYCISGTESQGDVKFSFDIEVDDTITVMVR